MAGVGATSKDKSWAIWYGEMMIPASNQQPVDASGSFHHMRAAVPGGTTGPIFDNLCSARLDWARDACDADRRTLGAETPERSNTRLLRQRLLTDRGRGQICAALYADAPTPEDKLADHGALTRQVAASLLVLLMG
jgi:6-phosphogluconolactonase